MGVVHEENFMSFSMVLREVQLGTYLGENKIIRYKDVYSRVLTRSHAMRVAK